MYQMFGIVGDHTGVSTGFRWGSKFGHYDQLYDFSYLGEIHQPYLVAASILTFVGCGFAPFLVRYLKPRTSYLFWVSTAAALASLSLLVVLVDYGSMNKVWKGPRMPIAELAGFGHPALTLMYLVVPLSMYTGFLALVRDWMTNGSRATLIGVEEATNPGFPHPVAVKATPSLSTIRNSAATLKTLLSRIITSPSGTHGPTKAKTARKISLVTCIYTIGIMHIWLLNPRQSYWHSSTFLYVLLALTYGLAGPLIVYSEEIGRLGIVRLVLWFLVSLPWSQLSQAQYEFWPLFTIAVAIWLAVKGIRYLLAGAKDKLR